MLEFCLTGQLWPGMAVWPGMESKEYFPVALQAQAQRILKRNSWWGGGIPPLCSWAVERMRGNRGSAFLFTSSDGQVHQAASVSRGFHHLPILLTHLSITPSLLQSGKLLGWVQQKLSITSLVQPPFRVPGQNHSGSSQWFGISHSVFLE